MKKKLNARTLTTQAKTAGQSPYITALTSTPTFPVLNGTVFADGSVPKEPVMHSNAVKTTAGVDNAGGWQYTQAAGMVKANLSSYSSY